MTAGLAAQAGRAVANGRIVAAWLPCCQARRRRTGSGCHASGPPDRVPPPNLLPQSAAPWLAKSGGEFIVAGQSALTGVALSATCRGRRCSGWAVRLTAGTSAATDWVCSPSLGAGVSVKALATLRWFVGPPRPDLVCWAAPVCNCSVLLFLLAVPNKRWVELSLAIAVQLAQGVQHLSTLLCRTLLLSPLHRRPPVPSLPRC